MGSPNVPTTPQDALSALAEGQGATSELIASPTGRALIDMADVPPQWPRHVQARAIRNVLKEVVEGLKEETQRETARAKLALTQQYSSHDPEKRIQNLVASGILASTHLAEDERPNQEWRDIRPALAQMFLARLSQLNAARDWQQYSEGYVPQEQPTFGGQYKFVRYHMIFRLMRRVGIECITYRLMQALADGVDSYRAVAWYYSDPQADVAAHSVANCHVGTLEPLENGGAAALLHLPHVLQANEQCFFASRVIYGSERETTRIVSHVVESQRVDKLTIGIQFDTAELPSSVWQYEGGREVGIKRPREGSPDFVPVSELGYSSHVFLDCENGRRYGIQWDW